jgi:hypothetical protein
VEMAWFEKVTLGKAPENLINRTKKCQSKWGEIFWMVPFFAGLTVL